MQGSSWRHFDFWLLGAVALLTIFGITMIGSTVRGNIDLASHAQRQFIFAVIGLAAMFLVARIDYHYWSSINRLIYIIMLIALVALNIIAPAVFGSARWFSLIIINIQPSEIAKIVMILVLAEFFARNMSRIDSLRTVIRSFVLTLGIVTWIILQPNLSTSIVIIVTWFVMLWVSGVRIRHLALFSLVGVSMIAVILLVLPKLESLGLENEYQLKRIQNFIAPNPEASYGDDYNVQQALISIGTGGWFGQGYGQGSQVQLRFLKVRWSDYIFSAMAEEFGFVGVLLVIIVLGFVIYRCLRAARLARDTFGALICYGVATLLAFQGLVNMGVNLRMIPATGLPLPFISYGGSSLFSLLVGIGLVESVILRYKDLEF